MSARAATASPNVESAPVSSPATVVPSTRCAPLTDPSLFKSTTYAEAAPGAPTSRSSTPSRSMSPTAPREVPNCARSPKLGTFGVEGPISAARFTVPSGFRYSMWTAPELVRSP